MRRGINLGGALDRRDGRAGWEVRSGHLDAIAAAGFGAIRLPVRWWDRGAELLPEVARLVEAAWSRDLAVVLTMHHADEVYAGAAGELTFELLNEPRSPMTAIDWNALLPDVLGAVREVDGIRTLVVGGADASSVAGLRQLEL